MLAMSKQSLFNKHMELYDIGKLDLVQLDKYLQFTWFIGCCASRHM